MKHLLAIIALSFVGHWTLHTDLCEGFIPENDLKIPIGFSINGEETGITEEEFNDVNDRIEELYTSIVEKRGGTLKLNRRWSDDTVNASAQRSGNSYIVNMYGGLARHKTMTQDGFFIVACHEMGHHIGGAPKVNGWFNTWASNEGQSDYFSTFKCFRRLYSTEENAEFVKNNEIDPVVADKCESIFSNEDKQNTCKRAAMAGDVVARFFQSVRDEERKPKFDEPSTEKVSKTDDRHPATQCRMDTYFAGAQCDITLDKEMSAKDPNKGTCNRSDKHEIGLRPLCWYKPVASGGGGGDGGGDGGDNGGGDNKCPIPIPGFCDEDGNPRFPIPGRTFS